MWWALMVTLPFDSCLSVCDKMSQVFSIKVAPSTPLTPEVWFLYIVLIFPPLSRNLFGTTNQMHSHLFWCPSHIFNLCFHSLSSCYSSLVFDTLAIKKNQHSLPQLRSTAAIFSCSFSFLWFVLLHAVHLSTLHNPLASICFPSTNTFFSFLSSLWPFAVCSHSH